MAAHTYSDLARHVGHEIVCVHYADGENVALECEECCEVLLDFDRPPGAKGPGYPEPDDG